MDILGDSATLALMERLQGGPKGQLTNGIIDQLHRVTQSLLYFRNVDGSFGEPMAKESLR
jgi:hypothetical protein